MTRCAATPRRGVAVKPSVGALAGLRASELRSGRGLDQFDWSHEYALPGGCDDAGEGGAHAALLQPGCSWSRSSRAIGQEMVFEAHESLLPLLRDPGPAGVKRIYDNAEDGGDHGLCRQEAGLQPAASQVDVLAPSGGACGVHARGWLQKGQVEKQVGDVMRSSVRAHPPRPVLCRDQREWLMDRLHRRMPRSGRTRRFPGKTVWQVFQDGAALPDSSTAAGLRRLPRGHQWCIRSRKTCLVRFDNNQYSVDGPRGRAADMDVRAYALIGSSSARSGETVAEHPRSFGLRRDRLRAVALRADPGAQARCAAQRRALQGLEAARSPSAGCEPGSPVPR